MAIDKSKAKGMSLEQVHKKLAKVQANKNKWFEEGKKRTAMVREARDSRRFKGIQTDLRIDRRWDKWEDEAWKKAIGYQEEEEQWDKIREEKVEEEVEVEEAQEQLEQEEKELDEAVIPTDYLLPQKNTEQNQSTAGTEKNSLEDEEDEDEDERINPLVNEALGKGRISSESSESIVITSEEEHNLEKEISEQFGDDEPERVYEDTRNEVKRADELLSLINQKRSKNQPINDVFLNQIEVMFGDFRRHVNKPYNIYEAKSELEKKIRKGVKKLQKQRDLIEKKDEREAWKSLNQYTSYKVSNVSSGYSRSRGSGLQFTIKKFR